MSRREATNLRLEALVYIYCFCLFRDSLYQTSSDWITVTECMLADASKEDMGKSITDYFYLKLLPGPISSCSFNAREKL